MERSDWLLLLLGFKGDSSSPALDPVRIQKGMFLLAKQSDLPGEEKYEFAPYNWGPYSRQLRSDLNRLVQAGYVQTRDVPGYTWKRYGLTAAGLDKARDALQDAPRDIARSVAGLKRRVTGASFNKLLNDVYTEYPEYAVNSLFTA